MYLTIQEVQWLAQTECECPTCKRIFPFSCLTELRRSDMIRQTWATCISSESSCGLFSSRKNSGQEYLDIPSQQKSWISTATSRPTRGTARRPSIFSLIFMRRVALTKRSKTGYCGLESARRLRSNFPPPPQSHVDLYVFNYLKFYMLCVRFAQ